MRFLTLSTLAGLLAFGLSVPATASAQSLAEIAEKQKKDRKGKPARVYTEEDLKKGPAPGFTPGDASPAAAASAGEAASAEGGAASAESGSAAPQKSEDELRAERQSAWRDRLQKGRDNVTQLTGEVSRLETALNDLTVPVYGTTRANRIAALEQAKQQLAAAQKNVEDLEEEGRRNGYR